MKVKEIVKVIPYGNIITIMEGSKIVASGQPNCAELQPHMDRTVSSVNASDTYMIRIQVYDRRTPVRY